jgi:nicotinate-nucleotide pyrophosphorylase (carboxylating)
MIKIIRLALEEDIGAGDVTSRACVPEGLRARGTLIAREPLVLAGTEVLDQMFDHVVLLKHDGDRCAAGELLATVEGNARTLLERERVALNFLQRLSGVATLARQYADAVIGTNCRVLDTRKTTPGLRALEKRAAAAGGVTNHRMGLYDAVLIKNNHIAAAGGVRQALHNAGQSPDHPSVPHSAPPTPPPPSPPDLPTLSPSAPPDPIVGRTPWSARDPLVPPSPQPNQPHANPEWPTGAQAANHLIRPTIEIEVRTLAELHEALDAGAQHLLLDNLTPDEAAAWIREIAGRAQVELSGGITLDNVRAYAETGADFVSAGAITHSARAVDIGFRLELL